MKRVLIVSYYWPPAGGSGVQRWVKFAKYLPAEGWQPVIYTPQNPELSSVDETLLKDVPAEAEIVKRPITEPYSFYRRLFGSKSSTDMQSLIKASGATATGGEVNPISGGAKSWKQGLSLWIRGNFFIPDPRVWWVRPSVRFLKKYLKEHPVDVIVTTGPPQSMHLIGRGLHRATGIPWVADFRDPWTRMFYYKHLHLSRSSDRRHHKLEKSVLDEASAIISVTPFVQREFQEMTGTPVVLITNGFDTSDFPPFAGETASPAGDSDAGSRRSLSLPGQADPFRVNVRSASESPAGEGRTERFCVTHTGLFAEDGNPLALWDALAAKCSEDEAFRSALRIRLVGKVDAAIIAALEERGLGGCVDALGYRSHDEAVAEQRAAGLLILPLRQEPEYRNVLPGKIFEYLAAGRPILGIGQEDGAAAQVLADTRTGVMHDWDKSERIRAAVDAAWDGTLPFAPSGIGRYTRESLTHTLATLLDQLA